MLIFLNIILICTIDCSKYIHTKLLVTFWALQAFSFLFGLRCCYACVLVGWASWNQAAIDNRNTVRIWLFNGSKPVYGAIKHLLFLFLLFFKS